MAMHKLIDNVLSHRCSFIEALEKMSLLLVSLW
jgi:hypothetical protein